MAIDLRQTSDRVHPTASAESKTDCISLYHPFRYIADPICVGSMLVYALNRWVLKPRHIGGWLVHDYLNDLLCLPLFLPIILRLQAALGIRRHDQPPSLFEVLHNWAIFSVIFELVLPRFSVFDSTADPWDVVAYLVGGLAAYVCRKCFRKNDRIPQ